MQLIEFDFYKKKESLATIIQILQVEHANSVTILPITMAMGKMYLQFLLTNLKRQITE